MKLALKLFAPLLFALVVFSGEARACSCVGGTPPCEAYWQASAVFVGQVVSVPTSEGEGEGGNKDEPSSSAYRFAVERPLRGVASDYVEVFTGAGGGDCGYIFERGRRYLVYAYRAEQTGRLHTSICSRTRPIAEAAEDLRYIDGLTPGPPPGGTIYGQVSRVRQEKGDDGGERLAYVPIIGVKVEAAGKGRTHRAETDAEGNYRFTGLPEGEYALKLHLPETLLADTPERTVSVGARGCAVVTFHVQPNGRLGGRVFDAAGRPAARVSLRLSAAEYGDEYFRGPVGFATSDEDGRYSFGGLPPGRYIIRIHSDGQQIEDSFQPPGANRPFPVLYHENVSEAARARVVPIGEGAHVADYDIHLPPRPAERTVSGVVVWSDGQPASGVSISYTADIPHLPIGYGVRANQAGRFSFKVYEGVGLKLKVSVRRADGSRVSSEVVNVPATGAVGEIRIVVPRP